MRLGAGADTVSIGIRAIMIYLLDNPPVYKRLRKEVDDFYVNIPSGEITYQQCLSLPYLQAVVKESGRMYPSIVYQIPRYVPAEGIKIAGYNIPPGTAAGMSAMAMNRSKEIFGGDANTFRPERWLENETRAKQMEAFLATVYSITILLIQFGYGSRTCIGKNIALVEMNKYIAQLIRHFDFEFVNKERPYFIKSMWFALQKEMYVRFTQR
jgi:cytochrome P450